MALLMFNQARRTKRCRTAAGIARKWFSVKTGTVMQSSKLGLQVWALANVSA